VVPSETNSWVPGRDEVEEFLAVLAYERLHVMTRHVVPLDAIIVEIVQNGQAGLVVTLRKVIAKMKVIASNADLKGIKLDKLGSLRAI
jgi:hypothetical protein